MFFFAVNDRTPTKSQPIAIYSTLQRAIYLCSKRYHLVRENVWKNLGDETAFDDYYITRIEADVFPLKHHNIPFTLLPKTDFTQDLAKAKAEKDSVMNRALTAANSLQTLERVYAEERGVQWKCGLSDKEMEMLLILEDELYAETMYEPWDAKQNVGRSRNNRWRTLF